MTRLTACVLVFILAGNSSALCQTKSDQAAVRKIPQAFCDAFNRHDGHELAQIMADDVDFVTVGAMWLHGRADFEKYHVGLLSGRFNQATITQLQTAARFIRPDIAMIHWSWMVAGDRNVDGTARPTRYGMMTTIVEKRRGKWLVVASQNDNAVPWASSAGPMPHLAMPIPGPAQ
jgi:uncharacterized protein (TIGR02246 family)